MMRATIVRRLSEKSLFREASYIDGKWVTGTRTFNVYNPATNKVIGTIPNLGSEETSVAIASAQTAFNTWKETLPKRRAAILLNLAALMKKHEHDLAALITMEAGKPLAEALGENTYSTQFVEWYAGEAERIYGDIIESPRKGVRTLVIKQPVGVVGVITPWNFPSAMITRTVAGALAAGCTVVIKPSELTPFSATALCQLAEEAGVPRGVINVVTGDAKEIGETITKSNVVRKISFTGSTPTGKLLLGQSANTVKKVAMELGGNAPFIVFEDADIDEAVAGAMISKFRNAGQTCVCSNRFFVHSAVAKEFTEKLVQKVKAMKVGNGADKGVDMGPLINPQAVSRLETVMADAISNGATVLCGGKRAPGDGYFFEPTVVTNVKASMTIAKDEIFGPIVGIQEFTDDDDVVRRANDTTVGLAGYFYTENYRRQWRVAEKLQYGMVGVNEGIVSTPVAPFGGVKQSGLGRDGSKYGMEAFLDIRYVLMGGKI